MKPKLLLIGAGGHARACIDVVESQDKYQIIGLVVKPGEVAAISPGYPVLGSDDELVDILNDHSKSHLVALVVVGQIRSPDNRIRLFQRIQKLGVVCPAIVAPTAYVSRHAVLGEGTIVMHGAVVNAGARIGSNCIINSHALIEHDVEVADHCHVSTGALVNGAASIGTGSFVGSGSIIREGVNVGERCLIGMGVELHVDLADACCRLD